MATSKGFTNWGNENLINIEEIKKKRKSLGLTQEELANKIEVTRQHYNRIEKGEFLPPTKLLTKIYKELDMPPYNRALELIDECFARIEDADNADNQHLIPELEEQIKNLNNYIKTFKPFSSDDNIIEQNDPDINFLTDVVYDYIEKNLEEIGLKNWELEEKSSYLLFKNIKEEKWILVQFLTKVEQVHIFSILNHIDEIKKKKCEKVQGLILTLNPLNDEIKIALKYVTGLQVKQLQIKLTIEEFKIRGGGINLD